MKKENLIIIPGFGTNSSLFKDLSRYLNRSFSVYFIDLPGFCKNISPLKQITMENYAGFAVERIKELNLESYLMAGLSLGFAVICNIQFDQKCKGILGIGPYLGRQSISPQMKGKIFYPAVFLNLICFLKLYQLTWNSPLFKNFLAKFCPSPDLPRFTLEEMDPRTYFETAKLILSYQKEPSFEKIPYVLIMNPKDDSVSYDYLAKQMKMHIDKLLVVNTDMDHNPKDLSQDYFAGKLPAGKISQILEFLDQNQPRTWLARLFYGASQRLKKTFGRPAKPGLN